MLEELDDPWFAPSDDELLAQLAAPAARSSRFSLGSLLPLAVIVASACVLAACASQLARV